jgi:deoxyhypusine synthase
MADEVASDDGVKDAHGACFIPSKNLPGSDKIVSGYDWSKGNDLKAILDCYKATGFQATNFGLAVDVINQMVREYNVVYTAVSFLKYIWLTDPSSRGTCT